MLHVLRRLWTHLPALVAVAALIWVASEACLSGANLARHLYQIETVVSRTAGPPGLYRPLLPWLEWLAMLAWPGNDALSSYLVIPRLFALAIHVALYAALWRYLRGFWGLSVPLCWIGLGWLTSALLWASYDAPLALSSYAEVIVWLLAAPWWLGYPYPRWPAALILGACSALLRETTLLIALLPMVAYNSVVPWGLWIRERRFPPLLTAWLWLPPIAWIAGSLAIQVAMRLLWPAVSLAGPGAYGHAPGWELLVYNAMRIETYWQLVVTLGLIPWLAWRYRPRRIFWTRLLLGFALPWGALHAVVGVLAETRLLLVPLTVVWIPCLLLGITRKLWKEKEV